MVNEPLSSYKSRRQVKGEKPLDGFFGLHEYFYFVIVFGFFILQPCNPTKTAQGKDDGVNLPLADCCSLQ